jgi:hypothetical protein
MYFNIGQTYLAMKDIETAMQFIEKSLEIRMELFGYNHFAVGLCLMNMGRALMLNGEFQEGI